MTRHRVITTAVRVLALVVLLVARDADAQSNLNTLIGQLDDSSDKVRLSAALNLTKLGDPKAILSLIKRLDANNESSKNVRSAAAVGLGTLVGTNVKGPTRDLAIKALRDAQSNDPSPFVQAQAEKALDKIGASGGSAPVSGGGGSIYVNVGPMSSKTGSNDAKFRKMMVTVSAKTLTRVAASMQQTWAGGVPNKQQLASKGFSGFYVDGTLNEVKIEKSGNTATISCKVSMLLASFPDKSVFGFLNGGAKVQGSTSQRDIDLGSEDCVSAVIEDLIAKKIVPTIKSKVGTP